MHCIGWNNCSFLIQILSRKDVFFLISLFRLYQGLKVSFEHNSVRKNLFLSACSCWDSEVFLREINQKFIFGGLIGYGNSYLDSVFRSSKVFRLHVILIYAAGAVRSHSGKRHGYCYKIGRGPKSCLLGHVTGLLFCLYVKLFLPSIFKPVNFWSSISLIVLGIELNEKNRKKKLGLFFDGSLKGFSFCPPKTFKPNKQTPLSTKHLHGIAWSSGKLYFEKLFAVSYNIKVMNAEVFAKGIEKCRLLTNVLGRNVEKLDDYGCPKIQDLVKTDSLWICSSHPFQHKTRVHCAEKKAKVYGYSVMQHLQILYVFNVFVFTTNLIPSTRHNFFYSIRFEKLSLLIRWLI